MKIAVIGANGKAGRLIVEEAVNRGLDVTAIVRGENKSVAKNFIQKDIMALTKDDVKNFDVVIDCFGAWTPETLPMHTTTSQHLCDILSGSDTRLLIIGGAGSLYVDKEHTQKVLETKDFPAEYLPTATAQSAELDELRKRNDVKWTFVSPAADFQAAGERTGEYILAGEEFTLNAKGESIISYADYAIAMVDEATKGDNIQKRISVLRK
ncbi:MAG: NAD(P)-dependent oxidoreductase [Selenomonadaceae bacterium]|nr:NAD(P)-dependent oxidoreductase [Selenomonadaceae bacterium]